MGLTSAQNTPTQQQIRPAVQPETPGSPNPSNFLDTIRKASIGTGLKEHERTVDDLKKENFDLKLRIYQYEDALRKVQDQTALASQNDNLKATNEALTLELGSLRNILSDMQTDYELGRREANNNVDQVAEIERLRNELNMSNSQLTRHLSQLRNYEHQLDLFDKESIETMKRLKQLEMENVSCNKKISELNKIIEEKDLEIKELDEELQTKNAFVQQVQTESKQMTSELEMLLRQRQDLEAKVRIVENEREMIKAEFDPTRRRIIENLQPQTPGSPRSSMDLVESRLLRQMGNATKQLEVLSKSNALTQSEKEHLQGQTKRLMTEINASMRMAMAIFERIATITGHCPTLTGDMPIDRVLEELAKLIEVILNDYDDIKRQSATATDDLRNAHEEIAHLKHLGEKLGERARTAQEQLLQIEHEADGSRKVCERQEMEIVKLQKDLRNITEVELGKYREHAIQLQATVSTLQTELEAREAKLQKARQDFDVMRRKCNEFEIELTRTSADSMSNSQELVTLKRERNELLVKAREQEDMVVEASKKLDEANQQLIQAERTKLCIQESFEKEMRHLHSTMSELKGQLNTASSGRTSNDLRLERLQTSLSMLEENNQELMAKYQSKDAAYSALMREHETILIEKQTAERDLVEAQDALSKAERDLSKLKRLEAGSRRNPELELLQSKLESAHSINRIMKEEIAAKERALQDTEEKLRSQEMAIRRAYADCEAQSAKIKKRETVINRVLKRLENLNAISGITADDSSLFVEGEEKSEMRF